MTDEPLAPPPPGVELAVWEAACGAVRSYCGWHVAPSITETITMDGSGGFIQTLPTLHLTAVTQVTNDGVEVVNSEWSQKGMIRGRWTAKFGGVVATIEHGHPQCPADVLEVLDGMVSSPLMRGVASVTNGSHQVSFIAQDAVAQYRSKLDPYRLPPRP